MRKVRESICIPSRLHSSGEKTQQAVALVEALTHGKPLQLR